MYVTVQSAGKPAIPYLGLILSAGLFLAAVALAVQLTRTRSGPSLAAAVEPQDFPISISPPRGFRPAESIGPARGLTFYFHGQTRDGSRASLAIWRVSSDPDDPTRILFDVLRWHNFLWQKSIKEVSLDSRPGWIGEAEGLEAVNLEMGRVARLATLNPQHTYVLSLSVQQGPIDPALYQAFDLSCRSVRLKNSSR